MIKGINEYWKSQCESFASAWRWLVSLVDVQKIHYTSAWRDEVSFSMETPSSVIWGCNRCGFRYLPQITLAMAAVWKERIKVHQDGTGTFSTCGNFIQHKNTSSVLGSSSLQSLHCWAPFQCFGGQVDSFNSCKCVKITKFNKEMCWHIFEIWKEWPPSVRRRAYLRFTLSSLLAVLERVSART